MTFTVRFTDYMQTTLVSYNTVRCTAQRRIVSLQTLNIAQRSFRRPTKAADIFSNDLILRGCAVEYNNITYAVVNLN